jgi:phenylacetate-coenzyme A ligase PaaK-like adenylate-forming protein
MKRKPPTLRRVPLTRQVRVRAVIDRQAAEAWAKSARTKGCACCGATGVHGHHVITQQELKNWAKTRARELTDRGELTNWQEQFERIRWDRRNLLSLCVRHHELHHSHGQRLDLRMVERHCPKLRQFARELNLEWWLENAYTR